LIQKLIDDGHEVIISLPESDDNQFFKDMGCQIIETKIDRRGINPLLDFLLILNYKKIMKMIKPDLILSYTIKPNIYGSIAARLSGNRQINNITGTGETFLKKTLISQVAELLYKLSVKRSYLVFFQNSGDRDYFVKHHMINSNYQIIPGSGVNLDQFTLKDYPSEEEINFIFIGRIMKLKGIDQYLETAKTIKASNPNTNFYVAGFVEEFQYQDIIDDYHKEGLIQYLGFRKDIEVWIEKCHCTILPSYGGEGVPNILLESAAMGRVCIASRINGSKEVVDDQITGYLFEPGNADDLIRKVQTFLSLSHQQKRAMGLAGRVKVENEFDRQIVIKKYLKEIEKLEIVKK
jgi:galacturonosyltransferase